MTTKELSTKIDNHAAQQAAAQLASIQEMISAYHSANESTDDDTYGKASLDGEMLTADYVRERIEESPIEIQVRADWHNVGLEMPESEYNILLCTGGPAVRIVGDLSEYHKPETARLEYQDWGTPWTEYHTTKEQEEQLIEFARFFYFGE